MAWIESHQELGRHPKTRRLARVLGITVPAAVGHLHFLWWWALDFAEDGNLARYESFDIADAASWDGDERLFVEALIDIGFLDEDGDALMLHDWHDYAGKLIERRNADRQRKRQERQGNKKRLPEPVSEVSDGCPQDGARSHSRTVPYSTVPNQTIKNKDSRQNKFDEDSVSYRLALHLQSKILEQDANTKSAKNANLQSWAQEADRMVRLDNREPKEAAQLMEWCQQHEFWSANILSMKKFREKYDTLKRQRQTSKAGSQQETAIDRALRELEGYE